MKEVNITLDDVREKLNNEKLKCSNGFNISRLQNCINLITTVQAMLKDHQAESWLESRH